MDADAADLLGDGSSGGPRRACDQCRLRKIRCDKESPCSNCRSARRSCSSLGLGQKPKEPRQRVLISSQYERKIDDMQERLAGIETLLRNLSTSNLPVQPPSDGPFRFASATPGSSPEDGSSATFDADDVETFEGDSSLAAHASFATDFLQNAVETNAGAFTDPNHRMEAALGSLREMAGSRNKESSATELEPERKALEGLKSLPKGKSLKDLEMPPMQVVVRKLKEMDQSPSPIMLLAVSSATELQRFVDRCRRMYFRANEEDFSIALFVLVNAGLVYLFFECSLNAAAGSPEKAQYDACYELCRNNVEVAIGQMPLVMPATKDNIEALTHASVYAVDICRPSLAWILTSRAAQMCRQLGLHQERSMRNDSKEERMDKAMLFWSVYMMDKGLSLRFGRASSLQDYDISLPSVLGKAPGDSPSTTTLSLWVRHSQLQGKLYEQLYSPGALRKSASARVEQINSIVAEVSQVLLESTQLLHSIEQQPVKDSAKYQLILKSDEVSYQSSLALAYRAIQPTATTAGTFASECLEAARNAMRSHQETLSMIKEVGHKIAYLHWTILFAPFLPTIILFCHVIETSNMEDLERLAGFVQSLEDCSVLSPGVGKLHRLSRVLYNVALLYMEAKAKASQDMDQAMVSVGNEFDLYLNQLGFMTTAAGSEVGEGAGDVERNMMQTAQLGDWFSGHNYVMGLVEEDLAVFGTTQW